MDTDALRLFVIAADRLNISAAGRMLGMAPAVASNKLAKLETALGADLLHRTTRKVSLSIEGQDFLPFAQEIIAQEDAAFAALGKGETEPSGKLRFAASSTFAQSFIIPLLPDFLARYPLIKLDLRLSDTALDLIDGSFDLALRAMALEDSSLKARKLTDDTRILCASPGYLAQNGTPNSPEELEGHRFIAFNLGQRVITGPKGKVATLDPDDHNCRLILDDGLSLKLATIAGGGISVSSIWNIWKELESGTLVHILPEYTIDDETGLWLVYPKSNVISPKVRALIDFLIEHIGKQPPWQRIE
ncbi:LysR family transcriptional regulator [Litorimonas haliclonae]|uniref:LysR family transcriptional regulator n=1 Tax=Litorimonas haliclonae TaxID=2081977 RepID=UPI0039EEA0B5